MDVERTRRLLANSASTRAELEQLFKEALAANERELAFDIRDVIDEKFPSTKTGRGDIVRLQLDGDALSFFVPDEKGAAHEIHVDSVSGIREILARGRVTGAMLEGVIAEIEDMIMPSIRILPAGARLEVNGSELLGVLTEVADAGGGDLSIESVERLFNELANVASGLPARLFRIPMTASFVLCLVLLREVMHHGGFKSAMVLP